MENEYTTPPGHGLLNPKYWIIGVCFWAIFILMAVAALADTELPERDSEGRVYVYGHGGGFANREIRRLDRLARMGGGLHVAAGHHSSSATFAIMAAVNVPNSCINEGAIFHMHLFSNGFFGELPREEHERVAANYPEPLRSYYMQWYETGDHGWHTYTAEDLHSFGVQVPICQDDGEIVIEPLEVE